MGSIIKEICVNDNGELYCIYSNRLSRKMKKRLVSVRDFENVLKRGGKIIPVSFLKRQELQGFETSQSVVESQGFVECNDEEEKALMNMVKEKMNNIGNDRSSTFRDSIAFDTSNATKNAIYSNNNASYNVYDYEEER